LRKFLDLDPGARQTLCNGLHLPRALKGARAAGIEIERFEIDINGRIVVVAEKPSESSCDGEDERNEWDMANDSNSVAIRKQVS
jgi:hypothetical protein